MLFRSLNDNDVVTFVIDDLTGEVDTMAEASALFVALDTAATVTDDGTDTTIAVGGATLKLSGVAADSPFNFSSLEVINDWTDGNHQYEAIDIVVV